MLKRVLKSKLPLIVYNPVKTFSLSYSKALHDAGALPVIDTEFMDTDEAVKNIQTLEESGILFGLRVGIRNKKLVEKLERFIPNLDLLIFSYMNPADLDSFDFANITGARLFLEITDINIREKIDTIDPHGLILKGNEAPGKISRYTSFILMQWYLENSKHPVFIHGGVGFNTAPGIFAAGANGLVLDNQLYLSEESPLSGNYKELIGKLDEADSQLVGLALRNQYRFFAKLGTKVVKDIKKVESVNAGKENADETLYNEIASKISSLNDTSASPIQSLFFLGQDGYFAKAFGNGKVKALINSLFKNINTSLEYVDVFDPMAENTQLAKEHGTRFPIVQGPMANISDNADFAKSILDGGALPFMALGSLPKDLSENVLKGASEKVKNYGAGMIGIETFNATIGAHFEQVKRYKVPFALFAGGVPSQVKELEEAGTKAYLHTPSVMMLENAIENGCKRFIFEGMEAGGHIGTLSSFALWESSIEKIKSYGDEKIKDLRLLFAGGVSTRFASWFISGMTSVLAAKGAKVGIQVGSVYLFTEEITKLDAIKKLYQEMIIKEDETILTGTTVGLTSRTLRTPLTEKMIEDEHKSIKEGIPLGERKEIFEKGNIGSLLVAARGFAPKFTKDESGKVKVELVDYDEKEQYEKGNYMVGDSLSFESDIIKIDDIHNRYFYEKRGLRENLNQLEVYSSYNNSINDEIAVVGMGCTYPDADNLDQYWDNILGGKCSIIEMPKDRFNHDLYYDPDKSAEDKAYSKIAGVSDFTFDNERFGYSKDKAGKISRSHQMILQTAYKAIEDAGYLDKEDKIRKDLRKKTAVIMGSCLGSELGNRVHLKFYYPEIKHYLRQTDEFNKLSDEEKEKFLEDLKEGFTQDIDYTPVHGIVLNMEAGRIAHHMGIEGINYTVDAACATSFTAIDCGIKELKSGKYDVALVGGLNSNLSPETFVGFSKMGALSNDGSFPFDERANGFVLGEGAGVIVLKRVKDAIRDGDKIHCIIKGMGGSSDGKGKAIAAPSPKGQGLALTRCYENIKTGVTVDDIDYIEAHGTSTIMGDEAELQTLKDVYKTKSEIGVSSVKSQIGHLLGGAGCAGFIKAALAVKNGILPPNANFEKPAEKHKLSDSNLYIIDKKKEWNKEDGTTRKAAVSSYGFGGINYHCVIEEYREDYVPLPRTIFSDLDYNYNDDRIVVAGLGVVIPGASNTDEFWDRLVDGKSPITEVPDWRFHNEAYAEENDDFKIPKIKAGIINDYKFNNAKFRIPPLTAKYLDRAQLFGLDASNQALEESGLIKNLPFGNKTAVIMGTIPGEQHVENVLRTRLPFVKELLENVEKKYGSNGITDKIIETLKGRYNKNTEDTIPGLLANIISGRIANSFNCNGPNFVVDSSCASSAVALDIALKNLKSKDVEYVVCGGSDANFYPTVLLAFQSLGLLSDGDCKFYDTNGKGYIMGEGASVQVLTTYKNAVENNMPILGEVNSLTFNSSVPSHLLSPSETVFKETIDECYDKANIKKKEVSHLDVFGFTNYFGDLVEKQAIEASFDSDVFFGNIKHQFGYFKAANPAVALTKMILMNKNKKLLANTCYDEKTTIVDKNSVLKANLSLMDVNDKNRFHLASNVNGIGGNHGHLLVGAIEEYLNPVKTVKAAKTLDFKKEAKLTGSNFKEEKVEYNVIDVHTKYKGTKQKVVALLSGQGAQHSGMMKELYDTIPSVKEIMDKGESIFVKERGYSLLDMMFGKDKNINQTENTQPAVFLSTAAVYKTLKDKGFVPDYYIGHSVGEYSALYCSGMLDFDDGMKLIIKRSDFMKKAAETVHGKIMVVFKNSKTTLSLIRESNIPDVYIANKNSEKQTAVSGAADSIDRFCEFLKDKKEMFTNLPLSGAFHTPLFETAAKELKEYMKNVFFNPVDYSRVISNVTGEPYPVDAQMIKDLLIEQITSPVEFIKSVENVYLSGKTHYIEIGPNRLLSNLLKYINIVEYKSVPTVDSKKGQLKTFEECLRHLESYNMVLREKAQQPAEKIETIVPEVMKKEAVYNFNDDFQQFKKKNQSLVDDLLYEEFLKYEKKAAIEAFEKFNFYVGKVNVAGVSIGLPGKGRKVFAKDNFDKLIRGTNFIEPLPMEEKEKMADMNVTRLFKQPDGNAKFVEINSTEDVIQLAGQLGYFDINDEYGIKKKYDLSMSLAIAAGLEALKDANIPLVMQYKDASTGNKIPDGYALPKKMQDRTGIIITSLFPNSESFIEEVNRYYYNKFYIKPYEEFESIYYHIMASSVVKDVKEQVTDWFYKIKDRRKKFNAYSFDRNFASKYCPLGSAHLAELIKAKGPNLLMSGACASTTQAIGVAEDWIRNGRCDRVIVIGGENATSEKQNQWIGTAFLALGAGTVKKHVEDAAKPFDENRNGTILGAGAVSIIVEKEDTIKERGFNGQAEILGTYIGNSAYHTYNIDVNHLSSEMSKFVSDVERRHGLDKNEYPKELVFMSHETYTPARGGSADAEIKALRSSYPNNYSDIVITNTKGYTGHTLGAAIEDAVLVKVLQKGEAPPIANLTNIPKEFEDLNLNKNFHGNYNYGLHLAAGFGSHFAFVFFKRVEENKVPGNRKFTNWMSDVSGEVDPKLTLIDNILCVEPHTIPVGKNQPVKEIKTEPVREVKETSAPIAQQTSGADISDQIKGIIADQTGYTKDMLEDELDLEADLGIDTVKQVEIFGKISSHYNLKVPEDLKLRDLNTINKLEEYITLNTGGVPAHVTESQTTVSQGKPASSVTATAKKIISEQTGYTEDMLEDELDLEADLGIDTVKQVEIFGKISSHFGLKVPEDLKLRDLNTIEKLSSYIQDSAGIVDDKKQEMQSSPSGSDTSAIMSAAKKIISDQTGYTEDMLEDELDLEADLGIDTVKQVEIFGKISSHFGLKVPEDLKLRDLNTIAKLTEYVGNQTGSAETIASPKEPEVQSGAGDDNEILSTAKKIIEEQTGYSEDMLDENLDLEADLGIDTVKQVEIFGKISSHFGLKVPEDLKLRDLNTIKKLTEYIGGQSVSMPGKAMTPAAQMQPAEESGPSSEVLDTAKKIIEEQTGYTTDMLEEDLDLEADLGIDTVKQVEIFGKISSHFSLKVPEDLKLRDLNTIRKLSEYINSQVTGEKADTNSDSSAADTTTEKEEKKEVKRFVPVVKEIDQIAESSYSFKGKKIIITKDSKGFSDSVKKKIEAKGGKVLLMGNKADISFDLTNLKDAEAKFKEIAENNKGIDGIIHLAPIDFYFGNNEVTDEEVNCSMKSLFLMIKSFWSDLDRDGTLLAAFGFDSVVFPYDPENAARVFPSFAGISGMLKTVNKELEKTLVKMVDFAADDIEDHIEEISESFLTEIGSGDTRVEVGYTEGKRYGLSLSAKSSEKAESFVKDGDTILVTGGMGGITFEILKDVAKQYKVKLIVLGTSDINALDPEFIKNPDQATVMAKVKEEMPQGKPLEIKRKVDKIIRTVEAAKNLDALKSLAEVSYRSCDVRDFDSVKKIVDEFEIIDGVLHAAGVEQSQFIEKKELSSFNLVTDVKIKGVRNLVKSLEKRDYKYFMTFSSVTARFGNEGQIDYTGANDFIGKFLQNEKLKHPLRRFKILGWTAWEGAGMATKESVVTVLKERGLTFLPLNKGIGFFIDELNHRETEAVFTGYDFNFDLDGIMESPFDTDFPFLDNIVEEDDGKKVFERTLSLERDLFLLDHAMDGTPIFLGSTGIETMAEAASNLTGKDSVVEVTDFSIPYGIKILKGRDKELLIEGVKESDDTVKCNITSVFKTPKGEVMGEPKVHYKGTYKFSEKGVEKEKIDIPDFNPIEYEGDIKDIIYNPNRLFMDGLFETIKDIKSFDGELLVTEIRDTSGREFFKGVPSPKLKTDAVIIDAMFQTGGLLEFLSTNFTVLPYKIKKLRILDKVKKGETYYCMTSKSADGEDSNTYQLKLVDKDGNLFIHVMDFQMVKLQRLAEEHRILSRVKF